MSDENEDDKIVVTTEAEPIDEAVIVPDDEPPAKEKKPVAKVESEIDVDTAVDEGVEVYRKQIEDANRKARAETELRQKAEGERVAFERALQQEKILRVSSEELAAQQAAMSIKAEIDEARRRRREAREAGDIDAEDEADSILSEAIIKKSKVDEYLVNVAKFKAQQAQQPKPQVQAPPQGKPDPVTGTVFTAQTQAWIDRHSDYWADPEFRLDAQAADAKAKLRGLKADTAEYFAFVEEKLGLTSKEDDAVVDTVQSKPKPKAAVSAPPQRRVAASSAPPSRAVQGTSGVPKQGVKLTGAQRDVANSVINSLPELFGDANPDQVYAKEVAKLQAEKGPTWWNTKQ